MINRADLKKLALRIKNDYRAKKRFYIGIAIALVVFIATPVAFLLLEAHQQGVEAAYPAPKIEILSSKGSQGTTDKYKLKLQLTDAQDIKIVADSSADKPYVQRLKGSTGSIEQEIPLLKPSTSISIEVANKYKRSNNTLIITRDKTPQELADEENAKVAADQAKAEKEKKRIEDIKSDMYSFTGSGLQIAILKEIKTSRTLGSYYVTKPDKAQYVTIPIAFNNASFDQQTVSSGFFTVQGLGGYTYDMAAAESFDLPHYVSLTTLQPGGHVGGQVAFILPKDQTEFTLIYSDFGESIRKKIYID